ncbi:DUF3830 family protein [Streptomyces sp. NPDC006393]|uniref:DUF3830 family protein n=1 Tax=Streptomyces sp. NPDC006393 TaxID=3156763 RepID=UPI00340A251A
MDRHIEISLEKRGVSCVARLLDDRAPHTCEAVWNALPLGKDVFHGKYARNEIYTLVPAFAPEEPGTENPTITPIPGDVAYFSFAQWQLNTSSHGYAQGGRPQAAQRIVDLAVFYERNNLLLNPDTGFVPATIFGTIVEGLDRMAEAAQDLWLSGVIGESLVFRRA